LSYSLFSVFGVEIEYAVVARDTLSVDPSVDRLLASLPGNKGGHPTYANVEADNELAAHVLELKCLKPAVSLVSQAKDFAEFIKVINQSLLEWNACLMPGGMHPFMDPNRESKLWSHEDRRIYETYDRIFGCRGHGWLNIQSVHLNLPFANDGEFARLHNAISLLLPILPALAAASPIFENRHNGWLDGRLFHYVNNQRRLPSIIGGIIPEPVGSEGEYRDLILAPMYRDIAPHDPEGLLEEEWLNSRAAIARFDRGAIEIRCLDTQERPMADLALCHWVTTVLRYMLDGDVDLLHVHRKVPDGLLKSVFLDSARIGMATLLPTDFPFVAFGLARTQNVREFLVALTEKAYANALALSMTQPGADLFRSPIDLILSQGNLAERILKSAPELDSNPAPDPRLFKNIYRQLCLCLDSNSPFLGSV
jgi:glutamate---cysteine ligase / carboxylate-amine ligase